VLLAFGRINKLVGMLESKTGWTSKDLKLPVKGIDEDYNSQFG
jgi:hypothetical protein